MNFMVREKRREEKRREEKRREEKRRAHNKDANVGRGLGLFAVRDVRRSLKGFPCNYLWTKKPDHTERRYL
jgi:hypothetical protein